MNTLELKKGIYYTGVNDRELRTFDVIMHTEYGTTYNSYVVKGTEKTALVETAKEKFSDEYLEHIEKIVPISQIDYLVVNHTEPDHSGTIRKLLDKNPNIIIAGSVSAINFLMRIVNREFKSIVVKEKDTLPLGGKTMQFMILPNLHWPDTMFTYIPEDKVLFSCDVFGAHYGVNGILRSSVTNEEDYNGAVKYYFDNIIVPFKQPFMQNALERIKDLDFDLVGTGHGPVLDSHIDEIIEKYREWCKVEKKEKKTVVIPYVSAYGYTKKLAEAIAKGVSDSGEIEVKLYDMQNADFGAVMNETAAADGILLGSPTLVGDALKPIWDITSSMHAVTHRGKLGGAFGSYGWSGEAVPNLTERLKQLKLKTVEGLRVRFNPNEDDLKDAYNFGKSFGQSVLENQS